MEAYILVLTFSPFLLSFLQLSHSDPDGPYSQCYHPSLPCGKIGEIGYPFWSDDVDRPSYCGSDGFKLKCPANQDDFPSIEMGSQNFNVVEIELPAYHMTLVRTDLVYADCSSNLTSTSLNTDLFRYDEGNVKNVTLFYQCPQGISMGENKFTCQDQYPVNRLSDSYAFYSDDVEYLFGKSPDLRECERRIEVQVSEETKVDPQGGMEALKTALGKGFGVRYTVNGSCPACMGSKGICGSNEASHFICHCPDGPDALFCSESSGKKLKVIVASTVASAVGSVVIMLILFYFYQRRKKTIYEKSYIQSRAISSVSSMKDPENNASRYFGVPIFTYSELEEATNNFDSAGELGDGGFGTVYYGKLRDGRHVAVKRLYENNYKRVEQFINEIEILTGLRHTNLVSLYGCTSRHSRELLLVYEYIPNGTLADHLHGERAKPGSLPWNIRMNIAIETASALTYLHASDIIHRDVKTNNILLDNHFVVKVADFGLSRLFPDHVSHISTAPQGTPGYVDPEYHECYKLTDKSDVYSFGVVLIELISSLPAVDITRHRHEINLSTMAINKIQNRALHELVDPTLGFDSDQKVRKMINAVAELAFQCLQNLKDMRPSMKEVLEVLRDIESDGTNKSKPEVMDISADDHVGLLKNDLPPASPDSNLASKSTTSNSSN